MNKQVLHITLRSAFGTALTVAATCLTAACDGRPSVRAAEASVARSVARDEAERARHDSIVRALPGYVVDSILPAEEEMRRFRAPLGSAPTRLQYGASSRADLVAAFVRAVETNDTTALARLVVDRSEFAYLIYPTSPHASPPYRQSPQLVWLTRTASTDKGTTRLFARFGGIPLSYTGFDCPAPARQQGANTVWSGCVIRRVTASADTTRLRMFGPIVGRDGRFKFLSLANGF